MSDNNTITEDMPSSNSYNHSNHLAYLITEVYRSHIEESVEFRCVIPCMPCMRSVMSDVYTLEQRGESKEAATRFFHHLKESQEEGKYQSFVDALREQNYSLLVSALMNDEINFSQHEHTQLIGIFFSDIVDIIDPDIMSHELQMREVISPAEGDSIRNTARNSSKRNAAFELLVKIPHKNKDWYDIFLNVLLEQEHNNLVQKIDPKFYDKKMSSLGGGGVSDSISDAELSPPSASQRHTVQSTDSSSHPTTQVSRESSRNTSSETTEGTDSGIRSARQGTVGAGDSELNWDMRKEIAELKSVIHEQFGELKSFIHEQTNCLLGKFEQLDSRVVRLEDKLESKLNPQYTFFGGFNPPD